LLLATIGFCATTPPPMMMLLAGLSAIDPLLKIVFPSMSKLLR